MARSGPELESWEQDAEAPLQWDMTSLEHLAVMYASLRDSSRTIGLAIGRVKSVFKDIETDLGDFPAPSSRPTTWRHYYPGGGKLRGQGKIGENWEAVSVTQAAGDGEKIALVGLINRHPGAVPWFWGTSKPAWYIRPKYPNPGRGGKVPRVIATLTGAAGGGPLIFRKWVMGHGRGPNYEAQKQFGTIIERRLAEVNRKFPQAFLDAWLRFREGSTLSEEP